jgi:hypothetical protein
MADLSREDFDALIKQGLTIEDIEKFESGQKPKMDLGETLGAGIEGAKALINTNPALHGAVGGAQISLGIANRVLSSLSDPVARGAAGLAENLPLSPERKANLKKIRTSPDIAYGSDVATQLAPKILEFHPEDPAALVAAKLIGRLGVDVATDPLTYTGFGVETKVGRATKLLEEASQAGQKITLDSKFAKDIADIMGVDKPSTQIIKDFRKKYSGGIGKTLPEQLKKGEKSLASVGLPFTETQKALPFATGEFASKLAMPLEKMRTSAIGQKALNFTRELFSTKSGNPNFDVTMTKFRDLTFYRKGLIFADARNMEDTAKDLTRELGIPREELNKKINELGEQIIPVTEGKGKNLKSIYNDSIRDALDEHYTDKLLDAQLDLHKAQKIGNVAMVDKAANDVATFNGHLNELHGRYAIPPPIDPKLDDMVKHVQESNAQQLTREISSGVDVRPMLADRRYLPHIMTPEAKAAKKELAIKNGEIPRGIGQKEFDDYLVNSQRREFSKLKPEVVDAWVSAGLVTKKEARAIKSTSSGMAKTIYDKKGTKIGKIQTPSGIDKLDELVNKGRITPEQSTNALHTLSIDEVNSLPVADKVKMFGKDIPEVFHTDPIYHTTIRGVRGEISRTAAEFYIDLKKRGLAVEDQLAPTDWVNVTNDELKGFKVPPETAPVLNKLKGFNSDPESVKQVLALYDRFHSYSKLTTLAIFPAYHTQNIVGNFFNNFLAGVTNPDVYRQAVATRIGKNVEFRDVFGAKWNTPKLVEEAKKLGVIDRGWYGSDIAKTIKQELEDPKWLTLSRRNKILDYGIKFGREAENNARMAHFIDRLRKGDTAEQAAMSVKKFLFDYGDLTDFEKSTLNRTFFFYTWTRKNIPLQLQQLVHYPAKYGAIFRAKYEIEKNTPLNDPEDEKHLYNWMKDNYSIRTRYNKETNNYEYFLLNHWLPAGDILKLSHIHEIAAQMLSPLPKELIQQLWNYDFFFKKEIEKYPGETTQFLGKEMPARTAHALKTIRLLNEIDKMGKEDQDIWTKVIQTMTGKNYSFNPDQALMQNKGKVDADIEELTKGIYRNELKKKPSKKETDKLIKMIEDKTKEYQ